MVDLFDCGFVGHGGGGGFGDSGGVPPTPGMVHNSQQFYKNEATRVQNAAHATISSLRAVLEKKNRLIRDYQVRCGERW